MCKLCYTDNISTNYASILGERWQHLASGKVRELFVTKDDKSIILVVSTDRISAFDHILSPEIPGKGEVLTKVTRFWLESLNRELGIKTHLLSHINSEAAEDEYLVKHNLPAIPKEIRSRSMLCKSLEMLPVECVVRGYLTGSAYKEYQQTGQYLDYNLPAGLKDGAKLETPLFTPAFKAEFGEHDENITFTKTAELIGQDYADAVRDLSLKVFNYASTVADEAGITLQDTKFEFGIDSDGAVTLADEVLTPDSSRYLNSDGQSFDKQFVRSFLLNESHWSPDSNDAPPALPLDIVSKTIELYKDVENKLLNTGGKI